MLDCDFGDNKLSVHLINYLSRTFSVYTTYTFGLQSLETASM